MNKADSTEDRKRPAESSGDAILIQPPAKKKYGEEDASSAKTVFDICKELGIKPGDRVEVLGHYEDETSNASAAAAASSTEKKVHVIKYWWPATLLHYEGDCRTFDHEEDEYDDGHHDEKKPAAVPADNNTNSVSLAVRALEFDPWPERGFDDHQIGDVCFLDSNNLIHLCNDHYSHWRLEGSSWEPCISTLTGIVSIEDFLPKEEFDALSKEQKKVVEPAWDEVSSKILQRLDNGGVLDPNEEDLANLGKEFIALIGKKQANKVERRPMVDSNGDVGFSYETKDQAREHVRTTLDGVLGSALRNVAGHFGKLTASQQAVAAEKVAKSKEMMVDRIVERLEELGPNATITHEIMQQLLQK